MFSVKSVAIQHIVHVKHSVFNKCKYYSGNCTSQLKFVKQKMRLNISFSILHMLCCLGMWLDALPLDLRDVCLEWGTQSFSAFARLCYPAPNTSSFLSSLSVPLHLGTQSNQH